MATRRIYNSTRTNTQTLFAGKTEKRFWPEEQRATTKRRPKRLAAQRNDHPRAFGPKKEEEKKVCVSIQKPTVWHLNTYEATEITKKKKS